ncbi:MAG: hypothetical protein K1X55_04690, partial [Chitinophagales bacterium]|nr:hypothetical protein [Chitinophagales bacterium]
ARNAGTDNNKFYIAGTNTSHLEIFQNNVLDKIDITSEGDMVRTYQFNYTNTGEYTYLTEVIETAYEGVTPKALNSTMFKYGDAPLNETEDFYTNETSGVTADIFPGDFNGDGFSDICMATYTTDANGKKYSTLKFYEKTPNVFTDNNCMENSVDKALPQVSGFIHSTADIPLYGVIEVADTDGDGKDEIVFGYRGRRVSGGVVSWWMLGYGIYKKQGGTIVDTMYLTNGISTDRDSILPTSHACMVTGDFNGDGRDDVVTVDRTFLVFHAPSLGIANQYSNNANVFTTTEGFRTENFDGDAKEELYTFDNTEVFTIKTFDGNNFSSAIITIDGIDDKTAYFGDFNGDGRDDVLSLCEVTPTIKYSNGRVITTVNFYFTEALNMANIFNETEYVRVADFNGDGKADIAHFYIEASVKKIAIYYSLGMSFKRVVVNQEFNQLSKYVGDFNADGRTETLHYDQYNSILMRQYRSKGKERLLTNIKDGYLRETVVDYKLFPEGGAFYTYTPSTANIYPLRVFQPRTFGVEKITVPNGTGDITQTTSFNYQYQNAKAHLTGKGFVGFEVMKTIDNLTGFVSESKTERIFDSPLNPLYNFAVTQTKTYPTANPAQLITNTTIAYNGTDCFTDNYCAKYRYIFVSDYVKDVHQSIQVYDDSLGNTLNTWKNLNSGYEIHNTRYADWVNAGSWQLSRPQTIYDTITRSGQSPYTTKTTLEYNAKGQITKQTQFANDASKQVVTDLEYNATYGQLTKETVTAPGETPRTTRYEYKANERTLDKVYNAQNEAIATVTAYDKRYNMPTAVTGYYANYSNSMTLDAFGRVLSTTIQPNNFTNTYSYVWNNSGNEISYVQATLTNAPDTKVHYDKLGRPYKTETENYAGNYIAQTNTFNSLGQVITTSAPDANGNTLTTTYTYADAYYRLTQQANSFATTNYTYSNPASGQVKVVTNIINGEMREITTDASGMMVKATDAAGTLNYTYNSQHNLTEVKLGADIINTMTYDAVTGYQTGLTEPNSGTSTYVYNGFGELKSQTRNGQTTTLAYDVLGRPTTRTEPDGTYTYTYVTTGNGKNQLQNIKKGGVIDQQYTYDALHRVVTFDQKIDGSFYQTAYEYNTYNDITKITYPGTFSVDYAYNARGMLTHIYKGGTTNVIYQVNSTNVLGQVTGYTLGNGKTSATTYQNNGMPSNFTTTGIQNLNMVFDLTTGNLTSRTDVHNGNQTEAFTYETALDRLKTIAYNGGTPVTIDYGTNGNITQKYDAGTYTYDNTKKNAVKTTSLACGITGAQSTNPQTIVYNHFNKPLKISQNGVVDTFMYNNNHDRIKTQLTASGVTTTRLFVGNYERETKSTGGAARHIYYIYGPDGLVCIAVKLGTNAPQYFYTYTDHLGSIVAVTNTAGVVQGEQSYDAWGRQRNADNWTDYAGTGTITLNGFVLDRGYTGHQHLKEFGIINMNGRLYDPIVGRMLNPDNFVQDATSTQAFNRYSYVVNNPLKYSDPSGWLKYQNIDDDWRETSYTTWYGIDWEGPGRGSGGGWSTHTGWTSTTYILSNNNGQTAGLNGYQGGENVPGDYLGSVTIMTPYTYNTFTMPDYSGAGNVVAPTGDMAAMGGGNGGSGASQNNTVHTLESKNNTVFLGDKGDNSIYVFYKSHSKKPIPNVITIIGHGNNDRFGVDPPDGKHYIITTVSQFDKLLSENTTLWEQRNDVPITVFSYACLTGVEVGGDYKISILQEISKVYPNVTFIGPSSNVSFNPDGSFKEIKDGGVWNVFYGGELIKSIIP